MNKIKIINYFFIFCIAGLLTVNQINSMQNSENKINKEVYEKIQDNEVTVIVNIEPTKGFFKKESLDDAKNNVIDKHDKNTYEKRDYQDTL
jgi:hypothetical protein